MSETNGQGKSRLDRIEEILERHSAIMADIDIRLERHSAMLVDVDIRNQAGFDRINASIERQERANEAAHERFEAEDKRLLTAQILMNAAMAKMNVAVEKMADGMASLELKMEETTGKLNALIDTVDGIVRKKAS